MSAYEPMRLDFPLPFNFYSVEAEVVDRFDIPAFVNYTDEEVIGRYLRCPNNNAFELNSLAIGNASWLGAVFRPERSQEFFHEVKCMYVRAFLTGHRVAESRRVLG